MRLFKIVGLTDKKNKSKMQKIAKDAGMKIELLIANNIKELEHFFINDHDLLLSFGTNIIVPDWILKKRNLTALNVHSAPPEYPGRDPHHFAVYDGLSVSPSISCDCSLKLSIIDLYLACSIKSNSANPS